MNDHRRPKKRVLEKVSKRDKAWLEVVHQPGQGYCQNQAKTALWNASCNVGNCTDWHAFEVAEEAENQVA
jgi:hypothetical protein